MTECVKIKTGIIGYGMRGKGVTGNLMASGEYDIAAIADIDPRALDRVREDPRLHNCGVFEDYRELLRSDRLEAVFVMVPQYLHRDITVEAFRAGKSVYCEKPMALTLHECDDMIKEGRKAGRVLMIGQQMRYHAHLNRMKDLVARGEIGVPVMIWLKELRNPFPASMEWAFDRKKSGGLLLEKNCHHFDFFNWFAEADPVRVFASGGQDVLHSPFGVKSDILDNAWVTVEFANGARAMLGICMFAGLPALVEGGIGTHIREMGVMGSRGVIKTEGDIGMSVEVRYSDTRNRVVHHIDTSGNVPSPWNGAGNRGIVMRFAQCLREKSTPEPNFP
ncbi:MAG: Gfo/Idh/MocA family oxidoreductase [Candidatus Ratteibacteria bacterium]